jgi:hypothetical protein
MREELVEAERNLTISKELRERLLKFFGRHETDDLEILEEEIIEDEMGRQTSRKLINRYVRRTDKEVQEVRDEIQTVYKQLESLRHNIGQKVLGSQSSGIGSNYDGLFKEVHMKLNGVIGSKEIQNENLAGLHKEYADIMDKNIDLKNKRIETQNEVATLREFVINDRELKKRLDGASVKNRGKSSTSSGSNDIQRRITTLQKEKQDLERQLKTNYHRIRNLEEKIGSDPGKVDGLDRMIKRLENSMQQRNDLQNNMLRSASSNVKTIEFNSEVVGSSRDDDKVQDLLDQIERKEKEINSLLDLKDQSERKRRVTKRKNDLSYNLEIDISQMEKKVREAESTQDIAINETVSTRGIEIELRNKEAKIDDQDRIIESLNEQLQMLEQRLELGPGNGDYDEDDEREQERLEDTLQDLNRRIDSAKRHGDYRKIEQKKKQLREKEEYIIELERQL